MLDETAILILGPLEVRYRGELIDLGVRRQRLIFGILALWAGQPVQLGRLMATAWPGQAPPATARNAIQICISRLRASLRDVISIVTVGDGYRLDTDPGFIDLHRFRTYAASARDLDGEQRVTSLRRAEGLWRGPVLSRELSDEARELICAGLDDERIAVTEERIDAELGLGLHHQLVGELTDLVRCYPTRERIIGLLMLALYRDGQAARALEVGRETRALFAEELGIDPGAPIRDLEVDILRQLPELLGADDRPPAPPAPPVAVPAQLPLDAHGFTGRDDQIAVLDALLDPGRSPGTRIALIAGPAGVGKTALAVHWAHRVRESFPDGQLYADLRGYSADAPVRAIDQLTRFLLACGIPAERIPADETDATTAYRSLLAERRMLIVLDNAGRADQIRPLLPGSSGCVVVLTSRDSLDGLLVRDGARRVDLQVLDPAEARALLTEVLGAERVGAEQQATSELAALCAHLPLALRIAAAALTGRAAPTISGYVARLRRGDRLTALSIDGDPDTAVRAAFDLSYAALTAPLQRTFRLISSMSGIELTVEAVAALAGTTVEAADVALARLVRTHLVDAPSPGRYRLHDLLALYAAEQAAREEHRADQAEAVERVLTWYLESAQAASRQLYLGQDDPVGDGGRGGGGALAFTTDAEAVAWLNAERVNLVAAAALASSLGLHVTTWQIAHSLRSYFWSTRHTSEWLTIARTGLAAAQHTTDSRAHAAMRLNLGAVSHCLARLDKAAENYAAAYKLAVAADWIAVQRICLTYLGALHLETGDLVAADCVYRQSLALVRHTGDWRDVSVALTNLGLTCYQLGRLHEAEKLQAESVRAARRAGVPGREASALQNLGYSVHAIGDLDRALAYLMQALPIHRRAGNRVGEAQTLMDIAAIHVDAGRPQAAETTIEAALAIISETGKLYSETFALNIRGKLRLTAGHPQDALVDHATALHLARQVHGSYPEAEALVGLANAARAALRLRESVSHAEAALAIAERADFKMTAGNALTALALALAEEGDENLAIGKATAAVSLHRETGCRLGEALALAALGLILRSADPATASAHEQAAQAIFRACGAAQPPMTWRPTAAGANARARA